MIDHQQTNGTKLASRSGSQDWILSLSMDWSIIISPVSPTAPPTMKATTFTIDMIMVPLGALTFQAGQYIPL
jgi:hypothetical protein